MSRLHIHTEHHLVKRIGWLRAAVLGANDGIVSTASLMIGVGVGVGLDACCLRRYRGLKCSLYHQTLVRVRQDCAEGTIFSSALILLIGLYVGYHGLQGILNGH